MSRSPVQTFADLTAALAQMCDLHARMQTEDADGSDGLVTLWDAQADRAMVAFRDLAGHDEAMGDIRALLSATYGGEPE
jgi:hypothetical protein